MEMGRLHESLRPLLDIFARRSRGRVVWASATLAALSIVLGYHARWPRPKGIEDLASAARKARKTKEAIDFGEYDFIIVGGGETWIPFRFRS